MIALERTLLTMHILNVNLELGASGEGGGTLIAVIIFDFEVTLQMLFDVLLLKRAKTANVTLESLLFQVNSLIMTAQI